MNMSPNDEAAHAPGALVHIFLKVMSIDMTGGTGLELRLSRYAKMASPIRRLRE